MTTSAILTIGALAFIVLGVLGGKIRAKEISIPELPVFVRGTSILIGFVLLGIAIWLSIPVKEKPLTEVTSNVPSSIDWNHNPNLPSPTLEYPVCKN